MMSFFTHGITLNVDTSVNIWTLNKINKDATVDLAEGTESPFASEILNYNKKNFTPMFIFKIKA